MSKVSEHLLVGLATSWRQMASIDPKEIEKAMFVLVPIVSTIAMEAGPQLDSDTEVVAISASTARALIAFLDSATAETLAVNEFVAWAIANCPPHLFSNMARVGLLV